jgi:hypothetical protein
MLGLAEEEKILQIINCKIGKNHAQEKLTRAAY